MVPIALVLIPMALLFGPLVLPLSFLPEGGALYNLYDNFLMGVFNLLGFGPGM